MENNIFLQIAIFIGGISNVIVMYRIAMKHETKHLKKLLIIAMLELCVCVIWLVCDKIMLLYL